MKTNTKHNIIIAVGATLLVLAADNAQWKVTRHSGLSGLNGKLPLN